MHYKPCVWCPKKKTCNDKLLMSELIKVMNSFDGIKATSIHFNCEKRQNIFIPGMRVSVTLTEWFLAEEIEYLEYGYRNEVTVPREGDTKTINGTVMYWKGDKVRVWLDEPISFHERKNIRVNIKPNKLTILNEPSKTVCSLCGRPEDKRNEDTWYCPGGCDPDYDDCI